MACRAKRKMNEDEEDAQKGVANESIDTNGESPPTNISKKRISLTADIDLLDCIICFQPLRPPLFQCQNGHVVCPSCCVKLQNKCPTCSLSIKYSRCIALEKLIESIRVPCSNNGCKEKISYTDLCKHEQDTCIHVPCFCPVPNCSFSGSISLLSAHVGNCHKYAVEYLKSGHNLILIRCNDPFRVIRVDNYKEVLFLLVNRNVSAGNALSMTCIGPQTSKYSFEYELIIHSPEKGSSLQMKAQVTMSRRKWDGSTYSTDLFLVVPPKFDEIGPLMVSIDITKKNAPSAAKQSIIVA